MAIRRIDAPLARSLTMPTTDPRFPTLVVSDHTLVRVRTTTLSDAATPPPLFRACVHDITSMLLLEATADLPVAAVPLQTPLESTTGWRVAPRVAIVPILRAGMGMVDAALDLLPDASVFHLGMYRDERTHQPVHYYEKLPRPCATDLVFLLDPMLATGGSAGDAIAALKAWGAPRIVFVCLIAAPEGVAAVAAAHPDVRIHCARLDRELDANAYIRPGLGDAGDRIYGTPAS
jgi:uracil phosphoribosyltransferase